MSSDNGREVTPDSIPNSEVKLSSADGSWGLSPARVGRCWAKPFINEKIKYKLLLYFIFFIISIILFQRSSVVEQSAVNRSVAGSNPAAGAKIYKSAYLLQ